MNEFKRLTWPGEAEGKGKVKDKRDLFGAVTMSCLFREHLQTSDSTVFLPDFPKPSLSLWLCLLLPQILSHLSCFILYSTATSSCKNHFWSTLYRALLTLKWDGIVLVTWFPGVLRMKKEGDMRDDVKKEEW